jgi:hypothetical protein
MATTTPTQRKQHSSKADPGEQATQQTNIDAVRELAVNATRIQLASLTAASKFVAGWAQAADRYAQAISDELLGRVQGETASKELLARLAAASSQHLREVTALPNDAVNHFNDELTKKRTSRTRAAKAA